MKRFAFLFFIFIIVGTGFFYWKNKNPKSLNTPLVSKIAQKEKPLEKYTFENLLKTNFASSKIEIGDVLQEDADFTAFKFYFWVDGKKISGLLNIPKLSGTYPVIVMFRGYVDKETYSTGVGTQRAGEVFAKNGFVTLSPDFLGYGESDNPSDNAFEERFQTYTTAQTLLLSISNLNEVLPGAKANLGKIGIWGHSNGGQIALSTLAISQKPYPTVLWAPVSKPFPYSILYYTDEFDDRGKALRLALSNFEKDYDVELYNPTNFLDKIRAPIHIHQGTADEEIPQEWTNNLADSLKKLNVDLEYFIYPGANHNMLPDWDIAVLRSIKFYQENL